MKAVVAKWGNSTAMRFPKSVADQVGLRPGMQVELAVEGDEVRLRPVRMTSRQRLEELVAEAKRLGPENAHPRREWGPARGSEILPEDDDSRGEITFEDLVKRRDPGTR